MRLAAVGCADPPRPAGPSSVERAGDTASIVCNETGRSFHIVCRGATWVGHLGNCTPSQDDIGAAVPESLF